MSSTVHAWAGPEDRMFNIATIKLSGVTQEERQLLHPLMTPCTMQSSFGIMPCPNIMYNCRFHEAFVLYEGTYLDVWHSSRNSKQS